MKALAFSAALVLYFLMGSVNSAQNQKSQDPCANAQTTTEMRDCAGNEYKQADLELNKVYKRLMSKLEDEGHKAVLKNAQQAWIKYRDTNCQDESYLNRGGTIYSVVYTGCLTRMTKERTTKLQEMLKEN
jgi:uncharacterized protein YecT (DUF1311 family)